MKIEIATFKNQVMKLRNRGAFHIIFGSFLTNFINFFGSIFLVRVVSKNTYGLIGYIENLYSYFFIFAGMGLGQALLRYVVLEKSIEGKYGYYKYALEKGTIFNLLFLLFSIVVCVYYPHSEEFETTRWLLVIAMIALPFQYLKDNSIYTYRAMFDNKRFAFTALLISVAIIVSRLVGAIIWDVDGVIYSKVVVNLFFAILLLIITKTIYFKDTLPIPPLKEEKKSVDIYAIQYMISNALWKIFILNDVFLLGLLSGDPSIVADYKVAYVLPATLLIINSALGMFIGPYFVRHESDHRWVRKNYKKTFLITAGLIGIAVLVLYVFAKPFITIMFGEQYSNVVSVMRLLLIATFINGGLRYMTAHLLSSMGEVKYNMIISAIGVVLQIGINIITIPKYGAIGAAYTSIGVYTFMAFSLFIIFSRKYKLFGE